jgi:hypothetical protein
MLQAKAVYKSNINGDTTIEQQIEEADYLSRKGAKYTSRKFEQALQYEVTRVVINILSNATIKYNGATTPLCDSIQEQLVKIFYTLHDNGYCYLQVEDNQIKYVSDRLGNVKIIDQVTDRTGITQRIAVKKQLEMYGVITDVKYSVIDERGVMGIFTPEKDVVIKKGAESKFYESMRNFFGAKKGQAKFNVTEYPMRYIEVKLPIADMQLMENEKMAMGNVARIMGIQEDMLLRGATYDNKENAIVQTYTDYKGYIYNIIQQMEKQLISFPARTMELYDVTFTGVPQLTKTDKKI